MLICHVVYNAYFFEAFPICYNCLVEGWFALLYNIVCCTPGHKQPIVLHLLHAWFTSEMERALVLLRRLVQIMEILARNTSTLSLILLWRWGISWNLEIPPQGIPSEWNSLNMRGGRIVLYSSHVKWPLANCGQNWVCSFPLFIVRWQHEMENRTPVIVVWKRAFHWVWCAW